MIIARPLNTTHLNQYYWVEWSKQGSCSYMYDKDKEMINNTQRGNTDVSQHIDTHNSAQ